MAIDYNLIVETRTNHTTMTPEEFQKVYRQDQEYRTFKKTSEEFVMHMLVRALRSGTRVNIVYPKVRVGKRAGAISGVPTPETIAEHFTTSSDFDEYRHLISTSFELELGCLNLDVTDFLSGERWSPDKTESGLPYPLNLIASTLTT